MKFKVYIPTKGRSDNCVTAQLCEEYGIQYKLFVESKEYQQYCDKYGTDKVVDLGGDDFGSVTYARNFIKKYSKELGEERHWQIDDDVKYVYRYDPETKENNIVDPNEALDYVESTIEPYSNVYIAGLSANTFLKNKKTEYNINAFPYTFKCIDNNMPYEWDNIHAQEDIDMALQILSDGNCTMRFNLYNFYFQKSNTKKGGFTESRTLDKVNNAVKEMLDKWQPVIPKLKIVDKGNLGFRLYTNPIWSQYRKNELKYKRDK